MRNEIYKEINRERMSQNRKHPKFPVEYRLSVLTEEVGEVAKALNENEAKEHLMDELIQVAAVAVRWIEALRKEDEADA